ADGIGQPTNRFGGREANRLQQARNKKADQKLIFHQEKARAPVARHDLRIARLSIRALRRRILVSQLEGEIETGRMPVEMGASPASSSQTGYDLGAETQFGGCNALWPAALHPIQE